MTVAMELAEFVSALDWNRVTRESVNLAKFGMLDCIGVACAAVSEPASQKVRALAERLGGNPNAQIIAGGRTSATLAALVNGTTAHALDFDDACSFGHSSVVLLPPILALAETVHAPGRKALLAYIAGFEIGSRFRDAFAITHHHGWHPTAVCGTMAATAAAAKMLDLSARQTAMALGIAASEAAGIGANVGTMTKPFHAGHASECGVTAAMLASDGLTASEEAIESSTGFATAFTKADDLDLGALTRGLGQKLQLDVKRISLKRYPSCYGTHWAVDEMLDLIRSEPMSADDIDSIECVGRPKYLDVLPYTRPTSGLEGKFSMQYCLAAAVIDGALGLEQFADDAVKRPDVVALMARVRLKAFSDWDDERDRTRPDIVTVTLRNGRVFKRERLLVPGNDVPDRWDEVWKEKFESCTKRAITPLAAEFISASMLDLESVPDMTPLTRALGHN